MRNNDLALDYLKEGLEMVQKISGGPSKDEAGFMMEIATVYNQMYKLSNALEYNIKSKKIFTAIDGPESLWVAGVLMNIGNLYNKMGRYYDADKNFAQTLAIYQKTVKPNSREFYRLYNNWGLIIQRMGDYDRALEYAQKALSIKLKLSKAGDPSVAKYYRNIGRIYEEQEKYEQALPYFQTTFEITAAGLGENNSETAGSRGELAIIYAALGQYSKALLLFEESIEVLENTLPPTHPYLMAGYINKADVYVQQGNYDKAVQLYEFAVTQFRSAPYVPYNLIAETQVIIAQVKATQGQNMAALQLLQEAMQPFAANFQPGDDLYLNPYLGQIQAEKVFLELLQAKSSVLKQQYELEKKPINLEAALETAELAIQLIEKMRASYQSEAARVFLNKETRPIFELAIQLAFQLYELNGLEKHLQKAFQLVDKNKASILWQTQNKNLALQASGIPQSRLDHIQTLEQQIASLEEELYETEKAQIESLHNEIFDLKRAYDSEIRSLEQYNPQYYALKYAPIQTNISDLKKGLSNSKTALIQYYYDQEDFYVFALSKQSLAGFRFELPFQLSDILEDLQRFHNGEKVSSGTGKQQYLQHLHDLHAALIHPIKPNLEHVDQLIIIPYGALNYLSFEMLAPDNGQSDFRLQDYLLKEYCLSYAWSAALWAKERRSRGKASIPFVGFGPDFNFKSEAIAARSASISSNNPVVLGALNNGPEIEQAQAYFQGQSYLGAAASESQFLTIAPQSSIIHLATHAVVDDQFPMRSGLFLPENSDTLEDGFLNCYEIYNLQLQADLAMMNACHTGFGPIYEGEGVMSLGRAFSYAGCKSIVMSLWLANDQATSQISKYFYKSLSEGSAKNVALRQAKLEYLASADQLTAHPYFWAPLVAVGDMEPINRTSSSWWILGIFVLGGLLVWLFFFRSLRSK